MRQKVLSQNIGNRKVDLGDHKKNHYVAVPRKQRNQDFSTNMLLKIKLGINFRLKMAPNNPQCTLKMLVIQSGPQFHFNEVKVVKNGIQ